MLKRDEIAPQVASMREKNMSWRTISVELGVSADTARMAVDKAYADARRLDNNARRRTERASLPPKINRVFAGRLPKDEEDRALATIPADTRNLTARLFGDPLPGRSALDQKSGASSCR